MTTRGPRHVPPVMVPSGAVYVVLTVAEGQVCDPWVFVDPLDAELRMETVRQIALANPDAGIAARLCEVYVTDRGRENSYA